MALELDIRKINTKDLKETIAELLENKKYSNAAKLRSRNFQDQKETPVERAMWWVDFVARNDDISFLKNAKLKRMNYIAKHSIDVVVVLTLIGVVVVLGLAKIVCVISKWRRGKSGGKWKIN